jgi:hypothetical protein
MSFRENLCFLQKDAKLHIRGIAKDCTKCTLPIASLNFNFYFYMQLIFYLLELAKLNKFLFNFAS